MNNNKTRDDPKDYIISELSCRGKSTDILSKKIYADIIEKSYFSNSTKIEIKDDIEIYGDISFTGVTGMIELTGLSGANWNPLPTTLEDALNRLAKAVFVLNNNTRISE